MFGCHVSVCVCVACVCVDMCACVCDMCACVCVAHARALEAVQCKAALKGPRPSRASQDVSPKTAAGFTFALRLHPRPSRHSPGTGAGRTSSPSGASQRWTSIEGLFSRTLFSSSPLHSLPVSAVLVLHPPPHTHTRTHRDTHLGSSWRGREGGEQRDKGEEHACHAAERPNRCFALCEPDEAR